MSNETVYLIEVLNPKTKSWGIAPDLGIHATQEAAQARLDGLLTHAEYRVMAYDPATCFPVSKQSAAMRRALEAAEAALIDFDACNDPDCKRRNCNHALPLVRKALGHFLFHKDSKIMSEDRTIQDMLRDAAAALPTAIEAEIETFNPRREDKKQYRDRAESDAARLRLLADGIDNAMLAIENDKGFSGRPNEQYSLGFYEALVVVGVIKP